MRWLTKPKPEALAFRSQLAKSLDMNPNIMLDIETMGTGPTAAIVSIGAVCFDSQNIVDRFAATIDLESSWQAGLVIEADTVKWWLGQSTAAKQDLLAADSTLRQALESFAEWIDQASWVWGNGSDFDNVILSNAYKACGIPLPWSHWRNRCYRTVKSLAPQLKIDRTGTHHNALDDATSQARHLMTIANALQ